MNGPADMSLSGSSNPLSPDPALLVKIGSAIVHLMEAETSRGTPAHAFDVAALKTLLDGGVTDWLRAMKAEGLLPEIRTVTLNDSPLDMAVKKARQVAAGRVSDA